MRGHIIYNNMATILNQRKPETDPFPPGEKHFKYLSRIEPLLGLFSGHSPTTRCTYLSWNIHQPPEPLLMTHFNLYYWWISGDGPKWAHFRPWTLWSLQTQNSSNGKGPQEWATVQMFAFQYTKNAITHSLLPHPSKRPRSLTPPGTK